MANSVTFQTLMDGPRNTIIKCVGILDTSDLAVTDFVDPATLSAINPSAYQALATAVAIKRIDYSVEDGLEVQLFWDATADVIIGVFNGREEEDFTKIGFLQNNAGAGKTGKIQIATQGWTTGSRAFTVVLHLIKQGPFA